MEVDHALGDNSTSICMNEEVFEIDDYTNATDFESLVSLLEQVIIDRFPFSSVNRKIPPNALLSQHLTCVKEQIRFATQVVDVFLFYPQEADYPVDVSDEQQNSEKEQVFSLDRNVLLPSSLDNDELPWHCHDITKWYGICFYAVVRPRNLNLMLESDIQAFLSAINLVCSNVHVTVPVLVQCLDSFRKFVVGSTIGRNEELWKFEMVHIKSSPASLNYLSGLIGMFKEHLLLPSTCDVTVTACFTYALYDWTEFTLGQSFPELESNGDVPFMISKVFDKPLGTFDDPVEEIQLFTSWKSLSCSVVEESEKYSDLTPLNAPSWWIKIRMSDAPNCVLSQHVINILRLLNNSESAGSLIGEIQRRNTESKDKDFPEQTDSMKLKLYVLPDFNRMLTNVSRLKRHGVYEAEMTETLAEGIVDELFDRAFKQSHYAMDDVSKSLKSAPLNGLVYNLSWVLACVYFNCASSDAMLLVWRSFISRVRQYFDSGIFLPSISVEQPDLSSCLLNQKLQLLNCCTKRRLDRDSRCNRKISTTGNINQPSSAAAESNRKTSTEADGENSSEEFFDCSNNSKEELFVASEELEWDNTELEQVEMAETDDGAIGIVGAETEGTESTGWADAELDWGETDAPGSDEEHSPTEQVTLRKPSNQSRQPEGRVKPVKDGSTLVNNPSCPVFVPEIQESPLMTEDMIEDQAKFLEQLGTDSKATELRMLVQSRNLLSDMESFKAANPGCVMEDFIRWYSPRDYDDIEGLSDRMKQPGNMWAHNWKLALPVPACRQKRIFDDTKEAENVFRFFLKVDKHQLAELMFTTLIHNCVHKLTSVETNYTSYEAMKSKLKESVMQFYQKNNGHSLHAILTNFMAMEVIYSRAESLKNKFCHLSSSGEDEKDFGGSEIYEDFVKSLMEKTTVPVVGASRGPVGDVICHLFSLAHRIQEEDDYSFESAKQRPITENIFPAPVQKEYILRTTTSSNPLSKNEEDPFMSKSQNVTPSFREMSGSSSSKDLGAIDSYPQRMYASISDSEFRVAFSTCRSTKIM